MLKCGERDRACQTNSRATPSKPRPATHSNSIRMKKLTKLSAATFGQLRNCNIPAEKLKNARDGWWTVESQRGCVSVTSFTVRELTPSRPCCIDALSMGRENGSFRNLHNHPQWKFDLLVHPAVLEAETLSFETAKIAFRVFVIVGNGFGALFREEHFLCARHRFIARLNFFLPSLVSIAKNSFNCFAVFPAYIKRCSSFFHANWRCSWIGVQISTR